MNDSAKKRVLVKEKLAPEGLSYLKDQGFEVDTGLDWTPEEFLARVGDYDALLIRSATKVTAEVIDAATNLKVVGRAGVGVDNVDVDAATKRGIIVVNAPASNVLSAAEHTIAMIMACARNIPQAHGALKAGPLGPLQVRRRRARRQDARHRRPRPHRLSRGRAGARPEACGSSPTTRSCRPSAFTSSALERAEAVETIYAEADFITVHLPKNAQTLGFISDDAFAAMKDGVRVINVARGGIIDEEALARALDSGKVAAAAIDVWPVEPTTDDLLLKYDQVVTTPHLGASTKEAQLRAGTQVAEQVALALKGQFAPNAVNVPLVLGEEADELMPYLHVCELLGKLIVQIADGPVDAFEITYEGVISRYDTRILTLSVLSGLLANVVEGEVNFVNVTADRRRARHRVKENHQPAAVDFLNLITVTTRDRQGELSVSGTTLGPKHKPRLVKVYRPGRRHRAGRAHGVPALRRRARHDRQDRHQDGPARHQHRPDVGGPHGRRAQGRHGLTLDSPISEEDLQEPGARRRPARRQARRALAHARGRRRGEAHAAPRRRLSLCQAPALPTAPVQRRAGARRQRSFVAPPAARRIESQEPCDAGRQATTSGGPHSCRGPAARPRRLLLLPPRGDA